MTPKSSPPIKPRTGVSASPPPAPPAGNSGTNVQMIYLLTDREDPPTVYGAFPTGPEAERAMDRCGLRKEGLGKAGGVIQKIPLYESFARFLGDINRTREAALSKLSERERVVIQIPAEDLQ